VLEGGGSIPTTGQLFDVPGFSISKYPVTNDQFARFMEAGGYKREKWWTQAGWQLKESEEWSKPRFWNDEYWNQPDCPVVGISWYEAMAFCTWLTDETDEEILLPTEQQWQRAAQGDEGRIYPWGKDWDEMRCNNRVKPCDSIRTTPVTCYEGKDRGDSPFGVVDMAGNVWEWCLTAYNTGSNAVSDINLRVLRGGSWRNRSAENFRTTCRNWNDPTHWDNMTGFRIARA
jgi:formylglycine-generating enzyme required for sulfatase activity